MAEPLLLAKHDEHRVLPAAGAGQPPRPDHRRHRHRQDRDAADARRELQPASACRCSWPTSRATCPASARPAASAPSWPRVLKERGIDAPASAGLPGRRSGTCSASRATRCAPRSPTWARCCWRACSTSTRRRQGVLQLVFKIADDNGLLLLDLKDLRAMLQHVGDNARAVHDRVRQRQRRQRSARSSAACCRSSSQGGDKFFGEPMLNIADFMQTDGRQAASSTSSPPTS